MKEKIKKYWWIVIIILITGGAFYWFELRPAEIRKECIRLVSSQGRFNPEKFVTEYSGKTYFDKVAYKKCLIERGLEK